MVAESIEVGNSQFPGSLINGGFVLLVERAVENVRHLGAAVGGSLANHIADCQVIWREILDAGRELSGLNIRHPKAKSSLAFGGTPDNACIIPSLKGRARKPIQVFPVEFAALLASLLGKIVYVAHPCILQDIIRYTGILHHLTGSAGTTEGDITEGIQGSLDRHLRPEASPTPGLAWVTPPAHLPKNVTA